MWRCLLLLFAFSWICGCADGRAAPAPAKDRSPETLQADAMMPERAVGAGIVPRPTSEARADSKRGAVRSNGKSAEPYDPASSAAAGSSSPREKTTRSDAPSPGGTEQTHTAPQQSLGGSHQSDELADTSGLLAQNRDDRRRRDRSAENNQQQGNEQRRPNYMFRPRRTGGTDGSSRNGSGNAPAAEGNGSAAGSALPGAVPFSPGTGPLGNAEGDERVPRHFKPRTLPAGLPSWFAERDRDKDGQLGMYEWPADQYAEFEKYDRNHDGFVTAEEVLKVLRPQVATNTAGPSTNTGTASTTSGNSSGGTPAGQANTGAGALTGQPANSFGGLTPGNPGSVGFSGFFGPGMGQPAPMDDQTVRNMVQSLILARYDRNRDNRLDPEEIQATRQLRFDWRRWDTNQDGYLDLNELMVYWRNRSNFGFGFAQGTSGFGGPGQTPGFGGSGQNPGFGAPGGRFPGRGGGFGGFGGFPGSGFAGPGGLPPGTGDPQDRARDMFQRFDTNGDGRITPDELPGFFSSRFQQWDTNKDGTLDLQEFTQGMQNMRMNFGRGGFGRGP